MIKANKYVTKDIQIAAGKLAAKIAPIYKMLDWWWITKGNIPTENSIYCLFLELYDSIKDGSILCLSSGGLFIEYNEQEGFFRLGFTVSEIVNQQ